jgi:hypothetical protein
MDTGRWIAIDARYVRAPDVADGEERRHGPKVSLVCSPWSSSTVGIAKTRGPVSAIGQSVLPQVWTGSESGLSGCGRALERAATGGFPGSGSSCVSPALFGGLCRRSRLNHDRA